MNKLDAHSEQCFTYSEMNIVFLFLKQLLLIKIIPVF